MTKKLAIVNFIGEPSPTDRHLPHLCNTQEFREVENEGGTRSELNTGERIFPNLFDFFCFFVCLFVFSLTSSRGFQLDVRVNDSGGDGGVRQNRL